MIEELFKENTKPSIFRRNLFIPDSGECDLPEYCTGNDDLCPDDVFKQNGLECESRESYCYQGSCRSHDDQCKVLWGSSGLSASKVCYDKNVKGDIFGNCNADIINKNHTQCKPEDVLCGRLQCQCLKLALTTKVPVFDKRCGFSEKDHQGMYSNCQPATFDVLPQTGDPGLVPDGAKCGDDMMCVEQKCVSIESFKASGKIPKCPDCHGHGVCSSEGNCHCDDGYAPPFCTYRRPKAAYGFK